MRATRRGVLRQVLFEDQPEAKVVSVLSIIGDCLDALLHPSARYDALTRARHRAFMGPRLLGSLTAFAAFPVYLATMGAPSFLEVAGYENVDVYRLSGCNFHVTP